MTSKIAISLFITLTLVSLTGVAQTTAYPTPGFKGVHAFSYQQAGKAIYVAPGGSGNGSMKNPLGSIQDAVAAARPGDIVYVFPGSYAINSRIATHTHGTKAKPIVIKAYDINRRPVLYRAPNFGGEIFLVKHRYHIIDGFIIDGKWAKEGFSKNYYNTRLKINEKSYRSLVVFAHHALARNIDNNWISYEEYLGHDGDYSRLRNCELRNSRYDACLVHANHITIEHCEIHHCLRGTPNNPKDCHGISCSHMSNLLVTNTSIHHVSGDCIQADPDIHNKSNTKLWDNLDIRHCKFYTSPLDQAYADWPAGVSPGENGVDTKTFESETALSHRPKVNILNTEVHGFSATPYFNNRSAFNIKFRTDWTLNAIHAYDNEIVFRIRGQHNNLMQGSATAVIANALCYSNHLVFLFERNVDKVEIAFSTFVKNDTFSDHANGERDEIGNEWAVKKDHFKLLNSVFFSLFKPFEATDRSNLVARKTDFVDFDNNDFRLLDKTNARGVKYPLIQRDIKGQQRTRPTIGAYE